MTAVYIILAIAAVIAIIIYIPADAAFSASYFEKDAQIRLSLKYFLLKIKILPSRKKENKSKEETKPKKEKPETAKKPKEKQPVSRTIKFARAVLDETWDDIIKLIKHLFTHTLQTKLFSLKAKMGTGNPMYTGIAYGAANAAVYNLVSFIDRNSRLYSWEVDLKADFNGFAIEGETEIIIRTRIAYIIKLAFMGALILLKILRINRRIKKNG